MRRSCLVVAILITSSLSFAETPPPTARRPAETTLHGTTVREDYRWLESLDDPEVRRWLEAQNRYTRGWLAKSPSVAAITERVRAIELFAAPRYGVQAFRGGRWFLRKRQPPRQQPWVVTRAAL